MNVPLSVDKYLIIAHQRGLLEISGKALILTPTGKTELNDISTHCMNLMKGEYAVEFDVVAEGLTAVYGRPVTQLEGFQTVMLSLVGTEARLLAFLLNEKDTDFAALIKALKQVVPTEPIQPTPNPPNVTPLRKKPKLDS